MDSTSACYCCSRPAVNSGIEMDAALNELGMLSTVTESRRQYLQERLHRGRKNSEPSSTIVSATPTNSPTKPTYQILHLNPNYITSVSTLGQGKAEFLNRHKLKENHPFTARMALPFGDKYSQESLENDAKSSRLARVKQARVRRYRKPYEVPWKRSIDRYCKSIVQETVTAASLYETPDRGCRPADKECCSSNVSTPEKSNPQAGTVPRSKSLDDLDFTKLRLAEAENHNYIVEQKEIDTVSQYLKDLHVSTEY